MKKGNRKNFSNEAAPLNERKKGPRQLEYIVDQMEGSRRFEKY
jgi:hypothetical protein